MPINVQYLPPMADIGQAANIAGLGEFTRQQQEQALREAQLMQQASQFQQQQQLRQQALVAEQQQQAWQANNRNQLLAWQRQNEVADRGQQQQWQDNRMGQQRQWEVADIETRATNERDRMGEMVGFQAANRGGEELEKENGVSLANFGKQRKFLSPIGVNALNDMEGKFRAIQKARNWSRPEQYAQAMSQFADEMRQKDIQQYVNTPKPMAEQVQEGSFKEEVLSPDGSFMGYNVWTSNVRNGAQVLVPKFVPHKPEKPDLALQATTPTGKGFVEWVNKNRKSLEGETGKLNYAEARKQYLSEIETAKKIEGMTLDDAIKEMEEQENLAKQESAQARPRYIFELPEEQAQQLWASAPKPKTPDEVRQLRSGTVFITPDGRIKEVP